MKAAVIGAGIFGCVAAKTLEKLDYEVTLFDAELPQAGSHAAACLMKPSWYSSMGKEVYEPSLRHLAELYETHDIEFEVGIKSLKQKVKWIDPKIILSLSPSMRYRGTCVDEIVHPDKDEARYVLFGSGEMLGAFDRVVIACGIWANEILERSDLPTIEGLDGRVGSALKFDGSVDTNVIKPFAPYRQVVAFNISKNKIWSGDGTAIKQKNYTEKYNEYTRNRCIPHSNGGKLEKQIIGIRPYVPKIKSCYFDNPKAGIYVLNGGAKNGTIAAGYCGYKIKELELEW